ncbi:MBL fold metallo-hydrolase [Sphingomonas melonis TY]|uniref:MBL fold metallo-hydrolase n=1 Tax=Sphingomonas melonis TY TaxID=621456 RepID=A0A154NBG5_9SPHN|nr:MBL fold metallo-hydrolase [Sphingomonas sp. TX0522]AOW23591.1 MBL fold metallo-hydrolase [Sphingomonas melonis TY]ATI54588.1 MBL fold metallo-hydrolase [Sphingomonas melonis]MCP4029434.1 MBL fold metallo-hydrolase [Sphingomonas sp.]KZB97026.1 MBL fold metallo-hydrolase [Sphingomonas melonis TY]MBI0531058.1 MBL fold metallo-hydrolase [Sphingomonas sp. TX0522]
MLVEHDDTRILVDTGPDMREQLLAADVSTVDAILWTHDHADHCHGIDDVRQIFHAMRRPVPGYARTGTLTALRHRFAYVFAGRQGYPPTVESAVLPDRLTIGAITIDVVDQPHGHITSAGLRFSAGGAVVGYATDFHELTPAMRALYTGLDVWIVDALRYAPHPTHPHVPEVLDWIAELRPKRSAFIHMDQSMDYATLVRDLPLGVEPGYDGLEFVL